MSGRRRIIAITLVASAASLMASSAGGAQTPQTAPVGRVLVSQNTRMPTNDAALPVRGRDIPALAVDPADPGHLVMIDEDFLIGQCDFHASFDGGKTWNGGHLSVPADFANPPCNTFDSGGYAHFNKSVVFGSGQNVYTTFASHRGGQERPESKVVQGEGDSVLVAKSTDGGRTFQTSVVAIPGGPGPQPFMIRPGVAVQTRPQGDRIYAIGWDVLTEPGKGASSGPGDRRLVTTVSDDGGTTWSKPVDAEAPGEQVREPTQPVVAPDGAVYVGWRNRDPAPAPNNIVVAKSADGGATWTRSAVADVTSAPGSHIAGGFPKLAVEPRTGAIDVVYRGIKFGDPDVFFQRSTDGGTTWSPPLRVNDDPQGNKTEQVTPQVFVAPNGRIDVLWVDKRNAYPSPASLDASAQGDVYWAASTDGGATFSPNQRVTDHSMDLDVGLDARIGSYIWYGPTEAPMGDDKVLVAWGDPRLGNVDSDTQDIWMATMQIGATGPAPVETLPKASPENLSVALAQLAYPGGAEKIGSTATSKVVVVNRSDRAAALLGAVAARANDGPELLSPASGLTNNVKDEVSRFKPSGAYVIGTSSSLSSGVTKDLRAAGVRANVVRLSGATPAEEARAVAEALDGRPDEDKAAGKPAFDGAVIVNPDDPAAASAAALAAALRYPVLFTGKDSLPRATTDAIGSLHVPAALVVGSPSSIGEGVMAKLPSPKRLGDAAAVLAESKARGLPVNLAFVGDDRRPVDLALLGGAAARSGALLVAVKAAGVGAARARLDQIQVTPLVDRLVQGRSTTSASANRALIVISIVLAVLGIVLLLAALSARKQRPDNVMAADASSNA